jgi:small subunit ribosomal protein S2
MAKSIEVSLETLLESGAHFGHQAKRWNPKVAPYMFGARGGVHIFDLVKTRECIIRAAEHLAELQSAGKMVLFVGTKKNAKSKIVEVATALGQPYVDERWLGGTITNFGQIRKSIKTLEDMKKSREAGEYKQYTKKERLDIDRKIEKLEKAVGGIVKMDRLPDVLFVVDINRERAPIYEAKIARIKVVGLVDSNADPNEVAYPIPMNDDATAAVEYVLQIIGDAMMSAPKLKKAKKSVKVKKAVKKKLAGK